MEAPVGLLLEDALVEQAPHSLDGVERDALGALHDAQPRRWRQARHEPVQELADDLVGERVERQRRDRTAGQAETAAVGPLRSRQHEQEEGVVAGPLQQVVQESDQAGVSPLQVLDDEHDRKVLRQAFEEEPPAREELLAREHLGGRQAEQLAEARGDELPVGRVRDPALEPGAEPLRDELLRVLLADEQSCPDHLRQGPVAHALAVGEAAPGVPEHLAGEAVDVLEELPGEPRLADAGHAGHEHEARRLPLGGGVEELLDEAQLVVASREGRLDDARALRAGDGRHDPGRLEEAHRLGLALQLVLAGVEVGDRSRRRRPRHLVDVAAAGRGRRLDARGGVDPVADDEALLGGLGRRDAAGDDPDAGLELDLVARSRSRRRPRRARGRPGRHARRRPPSRPVRPRPP